ncbi:uncharacterized protein LOC129602088 [Paramacrobiotus metropolitanus]|uniref:uncharacterized protein LOC129602088 n=1 Tax=Paramacrobiotus metropolitanus TaxID=2943436 RepID=UPI0024457D47|nr:uncharacterized protein LOC129602088 [Paramacrobiotus metropolitanus]
MLRVGHEDINVVDPDNALLNGRVVGLADNGLYIDLLSANRRRDFVPFDRVILTDPFRTLDAPYHKWPEGACKTVPVEVLRHDDRSGVWRWWPAEMLNSHPKPALGVVQGRDDNGATWTDIFPLRRVRSPVLNGWGQSCQLPEAANTTALPRCLQPGDLEMDRVPLPAGCLAASTAQLWQAVEELRWTNERAVGMDIADGELQCVVHRVTVDYAEYEQYFLGCIPYQYYKDHRYRKEHKSLETALSPLLRRLTRILRRPSPHVERETPDAWRAVTADSWQQVFACLDTLTQNKLRAVCSAWNAILDAPVLTANIVIQTSTATREPLMPICYYHLVAPLFKCLRTSTQRLILYNLNGRDFSTVVDMLHNTAQTHPGIHLLSLYVVGGTDFLPALGRLDFLPNMFSNGDRCTVHDLDYQGRPYRAAMQDFISVLQSVPCATLHLAGCKVGLWYSVYLAAPNVTHQNFPLPVTRLLLGGDRASVLWEAMEKALPVPSEDELRALAEWLAGIPEGKMRKFYHGAVCRALCATQSMDPRPSAHYHGKRWCLDGLQELRLDQLSRTALRFLLILPEFLRRISDKLSLEYRKQL